MLIKKNINLLKFQDDVYRLILNNNVCFFIFKTNISFEKLVKNFSKKNVLPIQDYLNDVNVLNKNLINTYIYFFDIENIIEFEQDFDIIFYNNKIFLKSIIIYGYLMNFFDFFFKYNELYFFKFFIYVLFVIFFLVLYFVTKLLLFFSFCIIKVK